MNLTKKQKKKINGGTIMCERASLKHKKRIVVKVGSSSIVHEETGLTDLFKLEQLVRVLW